MVTWMTSCCMAPQPGSLPTFKEPSRSFQPFGLINFPKFFDTAQARIFLSREKIATLSFNYDLQFTMTPLNFWIKFLAPFAQFHSRSLKSNILNSLNKQIQSLDHAMLLSSQVKLFNQALLLVRLFLHKTWKHNDKWARQKKKFCAMDKCVCKKIIKCSLSSCPDRDCDLRGVCKKIFKRSVYSTANF